MRKKLVAAALVVVAAAGALLIPVGGQPHSKPAERVAGMDLAAYSEARPAAPLRLLFIHHSCGGQLLAESGPEKEVANCILDSHENGGGLRKALQANGYEVREASYGSEIGEKTDLFDWLPKFRGKMDKVLTCSLNDTFDSQGPPNQVVMFKSCYPNSRFESLGEAPGNPTGPTLTVWNARATLAALLLEFEKHPNTLFVYLTAPPNAAGHHPEPAWKWLMKTALRKPQIADVMEQRAQLARTFNNWVKSPDGWLKGYPGKNVAVFDYYDVLTDHGESNFLRYPTGNGDNSHPSSEGQRKVAAEFTPFLNRAVRRAGLSP